MAPTVWLSVIVSVHVNGACACGVDGRQFADQPANVEPAEGVAWRVTGELIVKLPVHVPCEAPGPQLIALRSVGGAVLITLPVPAPTS